MAPSGLLRKVTIWWSEIGMSLIRQKSTGSSNRRRKNKWQKRRNHRFELLRYRRITNQINPLSQDKFNTRQNNVREVTRRRLK